MGARDGRPKVERERNGVTTAPSGVEGRVRSLYVVPRLRVYGDFRRLTAGGGGIKSEVANIGPFTRA